MESSQVGPFDARYLAFLQTITQLRPQLHRYCARMTGSVMDGEDIVQEALFEAYRKLDKFDESRPLKPWLFRISHNRCIDFLRRRGARDEAEAAAAIPEVTEPIESSVLGIERALEYLVLLLPPKERACVLLKDIFDYSLDEIAGMVDSTVGAVKAALSRGRTKLGSLPPEPRTSQSADPELIRIMQMYVERFNRRDWDGVRELTTADARLNVADAFAGQLADAPYFTNWGRWSMPWKLAVAEVDREPAVVILQRGPDTWAAYSVIRLRVHNDHIDRIADYAHCPWVILSAFQEPSIGSWIRLVSVPLGTSIKTNSNRLNARWRLSLSSCHATFAVPIKDPTQHRRRRDCAEDARLTADELVIPLTSH